MAKRWTRRIGIGLGATFVLWCATGLVLTVLPAPNFETALPDSDFDSEWWTPDQTPTVEFETRDGITLRARRFEGSSSTILILLHGVLTDSRLNAVFASMVRDASRTEVLALDLRGHGQSDGAPGDVDHVGQYGDDVADVLNALGKRKPDARLVLGGHSMGGGIVLRYAEKRTAPKVDGYLLIAPLMGPDSPTFRDEAPPHPGDEEVETGMQVHVPRLIGLLMLNTVGLRVLNGKPTLFFNVPGTAPIHNYSFRAMISMTPTSHTAAMTADSLPMLTIVGGADEAFHVERFPDVVANHVNGSVEIIERVDHTGVLFSQEAALAAARWLDDLNR